MDYLTFKLEYETDTNSPHVSYRAIRDPGNDRIIGKLQTIEHSYDQYNNDYDSYFNIDIKFSCLVDLRGNCVVHDIEGARNVRVDDRSGTILIEETLAKSLVDETNGGPKRPHFEDKEFLVFELSKGDITPYLASKMIKTIDGGDVIGTLQDTTYNGRGVTSLLTTTGSVFVDDISASEFIKLIDDHTIAIERLLARSLGHVACIYIGDK